VLTAGWELSPPWPFPVPRPGQKPGFCLGCELDNGCDGFASFLAGNDVGKSGIPLIIFRVPRALLRMDQAQIPSKIHGLATGGAKFPGIAHHTDELVAWTSPEPGARRSARCVWSPMNIDPCFDRGHLRDLLAASGDYMQNTKIPTLHFQDSLPRLPIRTFTFPAQSRTFPTSILDKCTRLCSACIFGGKCLQTSKQNGGKCETREKVRALSPSVSLLQAQRSAPGSFAISIPSFVADYPCTLLVVPPLLFCAAAELKDTAERYSTSAPPTTA
jgi:hypothetical protein